MVRMYAKKYLEIEQPLSNKETSGDSLIQVIFKDLL